MPATSKSKVARSCLPLAIFTDPAAIDQLKVLGEQVGVEVYAEPENKDAVKIAKAAIDHAKKNNHRIVIVDTAGRLAVDEQMMDEIARLKEALKPAETLFVVDSHDRPGRCEYRQGL